MTANVGKTTAFHGLEAMEAFRTQEMALHGPGAPRAKTAASMAVAALISFRPAATIANPCPLR